MLCLYMCCGSRINTSIRDCKRGFKWTAMIVRRGSVHALRCMCPLCREIETFRMVQLCTWPSWTTGIVHVDWQRAVVKCAILCAKIHIEKTEVITSVALVVTVEKKTKRQASGIWANTMAIEHA